MKFIVDKMPRDSEECPFFKNGVCSIDFEKCDYLTQKSYRHDIYYPEGGKCYHLKPLESEDTE